MSVMRYNQWPEDKIDGMDQDDYGEWVRYKDYEKLQSENAALKRRIDDWIDAKKELPDNGRKVIATYLNSHGKRRTIMAVHVADMSREVGSIEYVDMDLVYVEEQDKYFWPAGWYEQIDNWGDYQEVFVAEGEVDYWMPLPKSP